MKRGTTPRATDTRREGNTATCCQTRSRQQRISICGGRRTRTGSDRLIGRASVSCSKPPGHFALLGDLSTRGVDFERRFTIGTSHARPWCALPRCLPERRRSAALGGGLGAQVDVGAAVGGADQDQGGDQAEDREAGADGEGGLEAFDQGAGVSVEPITELAIGGEDRQAERAADLLGGVDQAARRGPARGLRSRRRRRSSPGRRRSRGRGRRGARGRGCRRGRCRRRRSG